jgi:hypothetical protein
VIVNVDGGTRPLAHVETLGRQRCECRFLQAVKQTGPRSVSFAKRTLVQAHQQLADRLIEFRQAKELPVSQRRYDPAFDDLYSAFGLRLVPRLVRTRGHDSHPVMHCELLISGIQIRIVTAGSGDGRLGVIGHRQCRYASEKFQRVDVRLDPGFQLLITSRFRVGVRTCAQHGNKQRCRPGLPRRGVIHGDRCPSPVHEHLLPGFVFLAQPGKSKSNTKSKNAGEEEKQKQPPTLTPPPKCA